MYAIKSSPFLRPASRPTSPATTLPRPDSGIAFDEPSAVALALTPSTSRGPLSRLAMSNIRSRSPARNLQSAPTTLVQDGSYLEALGLKLSEAITRALASPPGSTTVDLLNGRRPLPSGRGHTLGALITSELRASIGNPHLQRAIIRLLHRPLSVLLTNLSNQILPLISSPQYTVVDTTLNSQQAHAIGITSLAAELLSCFPEWSTSTSGMTEARVDGLQGTRDGLESIITRTMSPLMSAIKKDLISVLDELESPPTDTALLKPKASTGVLKSPMVNQQHSHPALMKLQSRIQVHARNLTHYTTVVGDVCNSSLANLLISLIWRALVALAHMPKEQSASPNGSPAGGTKKKLTPPSTPRMTIHFKPSSRPPSPNGAGSTSRAADAKVVYDSLQTLPRPRDNAAGGLACEAVHEAFESLKSLCALFEAVDTNISTTELDILTEPIPTLVALQVLLSKEALSTSRSVSSLLGCDPKEYKESCLSSFGREEECAQVVVRRVLDINNDSPVISDMVSSWLERQ